MREHIEETKNKMGFLKALEAALKLDERSNVDRLAFTTGLGERIEIHYKNGVIHIIDTTANSNYANAKEVLRQVYEGRAHGFIKEVRE